MRPELIFTALKDELHRLRWAVCGVLFCGIVAYGWDAFTVNLRGDDYLFLLRPTSDNGLFAAGRSGMAFIWKLTGNLYAPVASTCVMLGGFVAAALLMLMAFKLPPVTWFCFTALWLVNPVIGEFAAFDAHRLPLGLAILVVGLVLAGLQSIWRASSWQPSHLAMMGAACLGLAAVASVRQNLFVMAIIFALGLLLGTMSQQQWTGRNALRHLVALVCLSCIALGIYWLGTQFVIQINGIKPLDNPDYHLTFETNPLALLKSLRFAIIKIAVWASVHELEWPLAAKMPFLVVLSVALVGWCQLPIRRSYRILGLLAMAGFLVMPWSIAIVHPTITSWYYRALFGIPALLALTILALQMLSSTSARQFGLVAAIITIVILTYHRNARATQGTLAHQRDMFVLGQIYSQIINSEEFQTEHGDRLPRIYLVGRYRDRHHPSVEMQSVISDSYHTRFANRAVMAKLRLRGVKWQDLQPLLAAMPDQTERHAMLKKLIQAPAWPLAGSIVIHRGVAAVVLSPAPSEGAFELSDRARGGAKQNQSGF